MQGITSWRENERKSSLLFASYFFYSSSPVVMTLWTSTVLLTGSKALFIPSYLPLRRPKGYEKSERTTRSQATTRDGCIAISVSTLKIRLLVLDFHHVYFAIGQEIVKCRAPFIFC
jgi:hypothetical protein